MFSHRQKVLIIVKSRSRTQKNAAAIDAAVNYLTNREVDPLAKIPELKVASIKVEKI